MLKVIKMSAEWCAPCKALEPVFNKVKDSFPDVEFEHYDIDDFPDKATFYQVRSVPMLVFEKDGTVVDTIVGLVKQSTIEDKINELK